MIRKTLMLAAIGFVAGMAIGNIIAIISSYAAGGEVLVFSRSLLAKTGSAAMAMTIQTVCSGLLGAISMAGVILYDIERLPMLWTSAIHCGTIVLAYVFFALQLGWVRPTPASLGFMICIEIVSYAIIWLIMFIRYRSEVREMNELLAYQE